MEAWKIKKRETGTFAYGVFGTKYQAVRALPNIIQREFKVQGLDSKKMWATMKKKEIVFRGAYKNDEYGFDWVPEKVIISDLDLNNESEEYELLEKEEEPIWFDSNETDNLIDEENYIIEDYNGNRYEVIWDEYSSGFINNDEELIDLVDIKRYRKN